MAMDDKKKKKTGGVSRAVGMRRSFPPNLVTWTPPTLNTHDQHFHLSPSIHTRPNRGRPRKAILAPGSPTRHGRSESQESAHMSETDVFLIAHRIAPLPQSSSVCLCNACLDLPPGSARRQYSFQGLPTQGSDGWLTLQLQLCDEERECLRPLPRPDANTLTRV